MPSEMGMRHQMPRSTESRASNSHTAQVLLGNTRFIKCVSTCSLNCALNVTPLHTLSGRADDLLQHKYCLSNARLTIHASRNYLRFWMPQGPNGQGSNIPNAKQRRLVHTNTLSHRQIQQQQCHRTKPSKSHQDAHVLPLFKLLFIIA